MNWAGAATAFSGRRHYSLRFFSLTVGKQNPKYTVQDGIALLWSFWWLLYTAEGRRSLLSSQTNFHFHLMLLTRRSLAIPGRSLSLSTFFCAKCDKYDDEWFYDPFISVMVTSVTWTAAQCILMLQRGGMGHWVELARRQELIALCQTSH